MSLVAQLVCTTAEVFHCPLPGLLFVFVQALHDIRCAVLEHAGDEPGEFVRRGSDGVGGAQPGLQSSEEGAYGPLAVVQACGCQPESRGCPIGAGRGPPTQPLAA